MHNFSSDVVSSNSGHFSEALFSLSWWNFAQLDSSGQQRGKEREREREGKNGQTKEAKEEREKTKSENEAAAKIGIVPAVMTIIRQNMISSQTYEYLSGCSE